MKRIILLLVLILNGIAIQAQDSQDYIEFDDRKNVVHGFYLGVGAHYGRVNNESTLFTTLKLAYVANRKLEVGISLNGFYNDRENPRPDLFDDDQLAFIGGYAGVHIEPILFGKRFISVSFPLLIGGGVATYTGKDRIENDEDLDEDDFDEFFIAEPGVNVLYNFTRFTQLETGFRYRITSSYNLEPFGRDNLNGFSVMVGLKIGIFNLGRKKKIKDKL